MANKYRNAIEKRQAVHEINTLSINSLRYSM